MKLIHNNSFVYSDINRASNHKARYKKQNKRKFVTSDARNICRFGLLFGWNVHSVPIWAEYWWSINTERMQNIKTIKRSCLFTNRMRSVNNYLGLSKYKIADFSRRGLIKDFRKY